MNRKTIVWVVFALYALASTCAGSQEIGLKRDLTYKTGDGFVEIIKNGAMVARYVYKGTPKPYIYPIFAPNGPSVTRGYPMENIPDEPTDQPHHRSFWVGFGDVNGIDFWTESEKSGKIVQTQLDFESPSPGHWNIHATNDWIGPDGKVVCYEDRRYSFVSCDYGLLISTRIELISPGKEVRLGDTKEGFLAFRLAQGMQLKDGKGGITNSEGLKNTECLGKRARWVDYTGEISGKTVGIAIFDVPSNYGYPTYWHVSDYGLLAANPFGGRSITGDEKKDSSLTIHRDKPTRFVYIALIHPGTLDREKLDMIADAVAGRGPALTKN
ncbi:MAG: PmoA family protein [Armatimonadetes bacterium]|nr:PmoA family protein [Armatimonadota bacterium]